ncbi:hypothetical protein [Tychonema sp. LEGE 06208]|uniref:hypothetical protein n=1 Tax=Tychonema sp. LEGE 06208 TaxID=1828663 RepID=UPI00187ECB63|nr:hypothetical protein [Tychonema sp. LEGE 06208]MBE9165523.1 hypothetical protein [Tychonema sp. LEGE 06208]
MNLTNSRYQQLAPYLIFIFIVTVFFAIASLFPYRIEYDPIPQIKGISQWLSGGSSLINSVVTVNPKDISQDIQTWIVWHAPGVTFTFLPLIALGLPLGIAVRTTAYFLFLSGGLGWIKVIDTLTSDQKIKIIIAVLLSIYYIEIGSLLVFTAGDVIPWAVMPWVLLYAMYLCSILSSGNKFDSRLLIHAALLGLLLGGIYWLKYSAFLVSLGILAYLAVFLWFFSKQYTLKNRFILLTVCTGFSLLPVIGLSAIHHSLSGVHSAVEQFQSAIPVASPSTRGMRFLFSLIAAPGLGLFNSEIFTQGRLLTCTSTIFKQLFALDISGKTETFKIFVGLAGTLAAFWFVADCARKNIYNKKLIILWGCLSTIPFIFIAYISYKTGINLLMAGIGRYSNPFFILNVFFVISSYLYWISNREKSILSKIVLSILLVFFVLLPPLNYIGDWAEAIMLRKNYVTTENFIYVDILSKTNVKSVVSQINSAVKSPKDVVVLTKDTDELRFGSWLEMRHRILTLPIVDSEEAQMKITTAQDLRVILVVSKALEQNENQLALIKQRFAQSTGWTRLPENPDAEVSIWFSDLKA